MRNGTVDRRLARAALAEEFAVALATELDRLPFSMAERIARGLPPARAAELAAGATLVRMRDRLAELVDK